MSFLFLTCTTESPDTPEDRSTLRPVPLFPLYAIPWFME